MTPRIVARTDAGLPIRASEDAQHVCSTPGCTDSDTWACLFCGENVCHIHGRWAEGEGWACPNCVEEMLDNAGNTIFVSRRELEKERESLANAKRHRRRYDATGWAPGMTRPRVFADGEGWRVVWPRGDSFWRRTNEEALVLVVAWRDVVQRGRERAA